MRLTEQGKRRAVPLAVAESLGQRKRPLRQRKRPVGLLHPERRSRQPEQRFELFAPLEVREELAELFRPALEVFQLDQSEAAEETDASALALVGVADQLESFDVELDGLILGPSLACTVGGHQQVVESSLLVGRPSLGQLRPVLLAEAGLIGVLLTALRADLHGLSLGGPGGGGKVVVASRVRIPHP